MRTSLFQLAAQATWGNLTSVSRPARRSWGVPGGALDEPSFYWQNSDGYLPLENLPEDPARVVLDEEPDLRVLVDDAEAAALRMAEQLLIDVQVAVADAVGVRGAEVGSYETTVLATPMEAQSPVALRLDEQAPVFVSVTGWE